ncbi:nuclear receptor-binding factor 2-like isoform X2 [Mercenaria mercenaria]|nr:nuclear receptor-binding factor 2-like isoform X2 [Mercenaria mercenaria]XP_053396307.1 nuclear receptor-binding factor 2-like isoform X2 [Mercenaria mercenaria]
MLLKSGKYEEAITCHNRAAEYLLEAMQQTKYSTALDSLQLQHAHHLKQTDKLYDRQRRALMLQIKQNKLQLCHQSTQTYIQGPVVPASTESSSTFQNSPPGTSPQHLVEMHSGMENPSPLDEDSIYRTLTEQDSLIGLLLRRKQNLSGNTSFHSGVPVERVFYSKSGEANQGNKVEKETEDLRFHNEDLRKHVQQLLKEVEDVKKENKLLKEKLEGTQPIFSDVGDCDIHLIPDLPPLEMPQFDLDLLEQENKKKADDSETDVFGMSPL